MNKPKLIYRFRALEDHLLERELDALSKSYLYAPTFQQMNDPMEAFYETGGGADPLLNATLFIPNGQNIKNFYEILHNTIDKFALISFSDTYKNLPMWAYYASNFTGMCLEFDPCELTIGDLQNEELCPVAYAENALPSLTIADLGPDNLPSLIKPRLTRKRIEWAHEREWRYLTGADGKKHYVDDALRRVLLGPRVKPEHAKRICDALGNRPVEVLRGVIRGYDFSFQSIKPASSLQRSERVGAGNFSRHDALFEESKLELFLNVSIESLIQECERIKLRPNLDEICYINIATAEEDSIIIQTTFKLRGGHNTYYKNFYYDRNLKLLSIGNQ